MKWYRSDLDSNPHISRKSFLFAYSVAAAATRVVPGAASGPAIYFPRSTSLCLEEAIQAGAEDAWRGEAEVGGEFGYKVAEEGDEGPFKKCVDEDGCNSGGIMVDGRELVGGHELYWVVIRLEIYGIFTENFGEREKEKQDLEKELEMYRNKVFLYQSCELKKIVSSRAKGRIAIFFASATAEDSDDTFFFQLQRKVVSMGAAPSSSILIQAIPVAKPEPSMGESASTPPKAENPS